MFKEFLIFSDNEIEQYCNFVTKLTKKK